MGIEMDKRPSCPSLTAEDAATDPGEHRDHIGWVHATQEADYLKAVGANEEVYDLDGDLILRLTASGIATYDSPSQPGGTNDYTIYKNGQVMWPHLLVLASEPVTPQDEERALASILEAITSRTQA